MSQPETTVMPPDDLFRLWTMAELLSEPDDFSWMVRGLLATSTYGQLAGPMKALKSYLLTFIQAGLVSGVPIFGQFEPVGPPRSVLAYVGEGGRAPWTRRFKRVCAAMGIDPADLDNLHAVFDVAPIPSMVFQESLRQHLDVVETCPLVTVDPLYSYHGTTTSAGPQRGRPDHRDEDRHPSGRHLVPPARQHRPLGS